MAALDVEQKLWDEVEAYRLIRNSIVHSAGDLGHDVPQLVKQLLSQRPAEIQYSEGAGLVVQPALVHVFVDAAEALLEAVFSRWLAAESQIAA